jgi:hypothetical protein
VAREAGENNKEFSAAQKICQNLLVIFAGPPLATDYNLMFGGFFRLAAGNHKPLDEIFSARPRPSPLSLLHVATQYLSHTRHCSLSISFEAPATAAYTRSAPVARPVAAYARSMPPTTAYARLVHTASPTTTYDQPMPPTATYTLAPAAHPNARLRPPAAAYGRPATFFASEPTPQPPLERNCLQQIMAFLCRSGH